MQVTAKKPLQSYAIWARHGLLLGLVLVLALSPLLTFVPGEVATPPAAIAASKGKNANGKQAGAQNTACQIKKSRTNWKLLANCTITTTIEIPNGVTFDGNGKTITMTGPTSNYFRSLPDGWSVNAGILANGGKANVKDLTLKGSALAGTCESFSPPVRGDTPEGISFINTGGTIDNVTVTNVRIDNAVTCGVGISAAGTGGQRVVVKDAVISGSTGYGIWGLSRPGTSGLRLDVDGAMVTMISTQAPSNVGFGRAITLNPSPSSGSVKDSRISLQDPETIGVAFDNRPGSMDGRRVILNNVSITGVGGYGVRGSASSVHGTTIVEMSEVNVSLTGNPGQQATTGMLFFGPFDVRVANSTVRGASESAIFLEQGSAKATIEDSLIESSFFGVWAGFFSTASIIDSTIRDVSWGAGTAEGGTLNVEDSTIRGRGPGPDQTAGIAYFSPDAGGKVTDVAIAGFRDTSPDTVSCGILIDAGTGTVEIDDVSFPSPGNEQNICDNRDAVAVQRTPTQALPVSSTTVDFAPGEPEIDKAGAGDEAAPVPSAETPATGSRVGGGEETTQAAPENVSGKDKGKNKHKNRKARNNDGHKAKAHGNKNGQHRKNGRR